MTPARYLQIVVVSALKNDAGPHGFKETPMRSRRAVIYDDDKIILDVLKQYLSLRGYEVITFGEPVVCPINEDSALCTSLNACADIMITDLMMPTMNGIELLKAQIKRGCKLTMKNKALMSGYDTDNFASKEIHEMGCAFFRKPFDFGEVDEWLSVRELQMDLLQPLSIRRKEMRHSSDAEVTFAVSPDEENLKGTALNMSASGLCIKTNAHLRQGQSLTVNFGHGEPIRSALVLWLRRLEGGFYLAGLNLTESLLSQWITNSH
jgi:CheY-like chemotaxis protein